MQSSLLCYSGRRGLRRASMQRVLVDGNTDVLAQQHRSFERAVLMMKPKLAS
jgi:hypothetical protein